MGIAVAWDVEGVVLVADVVDLFVPDWDVVRGGVV